jgi:DNA-binding LytR/AlgR family response regulator
MNHNILFVEDNPHKRARIIEFIKSTFPQIEIFEAHSFSSGCQAIEKNDFSIILLDISMPTYDRVGNESGGKFRPFAGREIARKIMRNDKKSLVIFITQYNSFSDKGNSYSLEGLGEILLSESKQNYGGLVFYDSALSSWKNEIRKIIETKYENFNC